MQMMVVQSGQHRTGVGIEHLLGVQRVEPVGDFDDALVDPDVGDATVRQPATANQHVASLASISSRTRRLSAPSSGAASVAVPEPSGGSALFEATASGNVA